MAEIIENLHGRRIIRLSTDDVISIVKEYQCRTMSESALSYGEIRERLDKAELYIPEDLLC